MSGVVRFASGVPEVEGLPSKMIGPPLAPLLVRYFVVGSSGGDEAKVLIHQLLRSDEDRAFHDHPWDFTTHLLHGGYIEHTPEGSTTYTAPCLLARRAEHLHRLELLDVPTWTLLFVGPRRRDWGFCAPGMPWTRWAEYDGPDGGYGGRP